MAKMTEEQKAQRKIEKEAKVEAERKQQNLEASLNRVKGMFGSKKTTYSFKAGEEVKYGAVTKTVVLEVFDGGLYYKIEKTSVPGAHSREKETKVDIDYVHWTVLRPVTGNSTEILCEKDEFHLSYMQQDIDSLLHKHYYFGVDMDPEYQRDHVWDIDDKVALIDSLMKNYDLGKFLFNRRSYSEKGELYEIVDGKQRMTALIEFYEDRFAYKGLLFSQMSIRDQNQFRGFTVNVAEVNELNKNQLIELFIRVNTNGRIMSQEHLENVKNLLK